MISIRREVLTNPPKMSGCARAALLIEQPLFREAEKKEDVIIYFHQHHYILILHFFISILISIFKLVHQYFRSILVKKSNVCEASPMSLSFLLQNFWSGMLSRVNRPKCAHYPPDSCRSNEYLPTEYFGKYLTQNISFEI